MPPLIIERVHQLDDADNQNNALDLLDRNGVPIADGNYNIDPDVLPDNPTNNSIYDELPRADIVDRIAGVDENEIREDDNLPIGPPKPVPPDHEAVRITGVNMIDHGD